MDIDRLIAVSRLTDSLSRATTLDEVYTVALDALQNTLGITRAAVLLFDDSGVIEFVAARGLSDAYRAALTGYSQWGPETANPEPACISDVRDEVTLRRYVPAFDAEGIRAVGFFALNY